MTLNLADVLTFLSLYVPVAGLCSCSEGIDGILFVVVGFFGFLLS